MNRKKLILSGIILISSLLTSLLSFALFYINFTTNSSKYLAQGRFCLTIGLVLSIISIVMHKKIRR